MRADFWDRRAPGIVSSSRGSQTLELEADSAVNFRVELIVTEISRPNHVGAGAKDDPAPGSGKVCSATQLISECFLVSERGLRGQMGVTDECMSENFDPPSSLPAKSRTAAAKQEPRALVVGRVVRRKHLTLDSKPRVEVAYDPQIETVLIAADTALGAEVSVGVAEICLPVIVHEYALHILRARSGIGRGHTRNGRTRKRICC